MFAAGVHNVFSSYFRLLFMSIKGARLTKYLRSKLFDLYLRQSISWQEHPSHSQGEYYYAWVYVYLWTCILYVGEMLIAFRTCIRVKRTYFDKWMEWDRNVLGC
jgi:hypothetical protein